MLLTLQAQAAGPHDPTVHLPPNTRADLSDTFRVGLVQGIGNIYLDQFEAKLAELRQLAAPTIRTKLASEDYTGKAATFLRGANICDADPTAQCQQAVKQALATYQGSARIFSQFAAAPINADEAVYLRQFLELDHELEFLAESIR